VVAAVVGVALLAVPGSPFHKSPTLGLDLQGGLEVVLKAQPPPGHKLTATDLDRSVSIMRSRVDRLGVSEPEIRKQGTDQIAIELAGVHDPNRALAIIGKTAQLELYDLETSATGPSLANAQGNVTATSSLYDLLAGQQAKAKRTKPAPSAYYLFDTKKRLRAGPAPSINGKNGLLTSTDLLTSTRKNTVKFHGTLPKGFKAFAVPGNTVVISCGPPAVVCPQSTGPTPPTQTYYYLFKHDLSNPNTQNRFPQMTGSDLKLSGTQADFASDSGQPEVLMSFTSKGGKIFHQITREEYQRGKALGNPQHFAIVLDGQIKSFPQIDPTDSSLADGIDPVNGARITGLSSFSEAKDLALVLQTGALPVNFVTLERTDVSATLGKDSLQQAKRAAIGGLIVVALFLLLLYRFLGLVAVIGLAIYAALLYAAILILGVTLTLPGFAGMILTIGVAADANVVIFERIKEEVRAGKSVRAAISAGYSKGFRTILDANVVTAITALILFGVATAGVKGFALMLLIGTVISLLTAVAATRAMLGLLAGFKWFENPSFMGAHGAQRGRWMQIDFMGKRNTWFAISGAIVLIAASSLVVRGLNFGIDFKGGVQIAFKTDQPTSLAKVRSQTQQIGRGDAVVQGRGGRTGAESYRSFQIRLKKLTSADQNTLTGDLESRVNAKSLGVTNVSSSFGRQIARAAILAIVVSMLLIVIYIWFRFDVKYAVPVIIAMLHDVVITVGVYSLTGREVTASTVAAVLTVLGYSIYDTIIIFDRIRENTPLMRRAPFAQIANISLWETIRRSLATTLITILPVLSLEFFGGATLKDFAFALLVGIISGAYSSIFIAAPLLTLWKEREPEYARRMTAGEDSSEGGAIGRKLPRFGRPGAPAVMTDEQALAESEAALAAEPNPELFDVAPSTAESEAKRERRRQRRRTRPHGRPN
jgi:SecD/SecF fusion protein